MDSSNGNCRGASSGEYITIFLVFICVQISLCNLLNSYMGTFVPYVLKVNLKNYILFKKLAYKNWPFLLVIKNCVDFEFCGF